MLIKVTEDHIKNGRRGSACECPVALAIKEATGCQDVRVGTSRLTIKNLGDDCHDFLLPEKVFNFIWGFDHGKKVAPFEFEIG
jgi:hypothetical protein